MEYEEEWLSQCCSAPPLYSIDVEEDLDPIGICMYCREHTGFEMEEE
mgnify:CR=1 FL=1